MQHRNLDQRLHQRGRRSGAIIGVSIAAAMLLGIVTFVLVYALVDPLTTEFISKGGAEANLPAPERLPTQVTSDPTAVSVAAANVAGVPTPTVEVELLSNAAATADDAAFQPDYRVVQRINLRSGPGTSYGVVAVLTAGTELQLIDEDAATVGQRPDQRWLKFRTAGGDEGWIREIDVEPMFP
jgi:hypothetical protein